MPEQNDFSKVTSFCNSLFRIRGHLLRPFHFISPFFRVLTALLLILCLSTLDNPQLVEAQTTNFRVSSTYSATVNSTVTINISIENPQQVRGCYFRLNYDPSIVRATGVQKGTMLTSNDILYAELGEAGNGWITVDWHNQNYNTLSGGGVLFRIDFTVLTSGSTTLVAENLSLFGSPVTPQVYNGTISTSSTAGTLEITTSAYLPGATRNSSYSTSLQAGGGTSPYTWTRTSGSLPPGLSLNSTGTISGTPTSIGTYTFTARVTDSDGRTASKYFYLTVHESGYTPLSITSSATLPRARTGYSYSTSLKAGGGRTPYTWTRTGGSLPPGLSLSSTGTISGTPTSTGTYTFTARVTDNNYARQEKQFTITVTDAASLSHNDAPFKTLYITRDTMRLYLTPNEMPYTMFVDNDINWVNLMVTLENSSDRLRINGSNFYAGIDRTIPLSTRNNLITIGISPDGYDYRNYTLNIYRLP